MASYRDWISLHHTANMIIIKGSEPKERKLVLSSFKNVITGIPTTSRIFKKKLLQKKYDY
jgi:hypothetical protein